MDAAALEEARASGRGIVVLIVHEVHFIPGLAAVGRALGTGTIVTGPAWYAPPTDAGTLMNWLLGHYLVDGGMSFLRTLSGAKDQIREILRAGGVVVQMIDVAGSLAIEVDRRSVKVAAGPMRNALATDSLLVFARTNRDCWRFPVVTFGPILDSRGLQETAIAGLLADEIRPVDGRVVLTSGPA